MRNQSASSDLFGTGPLKGVRDALEELADGLGFESILSQYAGGDHRGLLIVGQGRQILFYNSAACTLLGSGSTVPRFLAEAIRDPNVVFAVGEAVHDRKDVWQESYLPNPDRLLLFHAIPILARTSEPELVVVSIEDVTRLRHLETVRRDFVANVSHELRTPLASINLLVETLQTAGMEDPEAADHFLHRIEVETQAMARLVEELLELSRLESGTLSLQVEPVSLRGLLEGVTERLSPTSEDKGVDLRLDLGVSDLQVQVDPKRLEQVLMNLTHNAIKFTTAGGVVSLRATRRGPGAVVEVTDTGVGMEAAEASRVFERFYKVDKGRNRAGGTGLGLAIARHLLELHGSQLYVVSEVGRGSKFSFALPLAD